MLRGTVAYSLSLALALLVPAGANAGWQCAMGSHCMCHVGWDCTAVIPTVAAPDCSHVMPAPDQNWLAQTESVQAPEYASAAALPAAFWEPPHESKSGHTPILPLNERWAPPLSPLAQTSLFCV